MVRVSVTRVLGYFEGVNGFRVLIFSAIPREILWCMRTVLITLGTTSIGLAGLYHVNVFQLESITWRKPKTWKAFGIRSQEDADTIQPMAFNQGFYNLFLALGVAAGLVALINNSTIGFTLLVSAALSMIGAGTVLLISVEKSLRAAVLQAGPPLIGVVLLLIGFAVS